MKLKDLKPRLYAFVYGPSGCGKTLLAMSLANEDGSGVAYVTAEDNGMMSLKSAGYSDELEFTLVGRPGADPFEETCQALKRYSTDASIHTICLDGVSVLCGRAVEFLSGGAGEKALGWDGWGEVLGGFRRIESALDKAARAGKSIVVTAWELPPTYEDTEAGQSVKAKGCPWIQGKGRYWLPGNADLIGHMTSKVVRKPGPDGKLVDVWTSTIQTQPSEEWEAKTRLRIPSVVPANLKTVLEMSRQAVPASPKQVPQTPKAVSPVAKKGSKQ